MDWSISSGDTSANIFEALSAIGAMDDLAVALSKDFNGIFNRLGQIPEEIIHGIISGRDENERTLWECIFYVQEVVEEILKHRLRAHRPRLEDLEKKLHAALENSLISVESLRLVRMYFQSFCKKYPPHRMPDWERPVDDDEYQHSSYDDFECWQHDLWWQDSVLPRKVGEREKTTLRRSTCAIKCYITHLNTLIPPGRNLHPDISQKYIAEESVRIALMKHIITTIRDMLDWWNNHMPYHALCAHGEPLGHNFFGLDIIETIKTWGQVCNRLNLNKKKS